MKKQIIIAIILMFSIISCSKDKEQVQPKKSVNITKNILTNTMWESNTQINTYKKTDGTVYDKVGNSTILFTYTVSNDTLYTNSYKVITSTDTLTISVKNDNYIKISNDSLYADGNFVGKRK